MSLEYHGRKLIKFLNAEVDIQFVFEMALILEKCEIEFNPIMAEGCEIDIIGRTSKAKIKIVLDNSLSTEERLLMKACIDQVIKNESLNGWTLSLLLGRRMKNNDKTYCFKKEHFLRVKTVAKEIRRHQNWLKRLVDEIIFTNSPLYRIFCLVSDPKEDLKEGGRVFTGLIFLTAYESLSFIPVFARNGIRKKLGYDPFTAVEDPLDSYAFVREVNAYIAYHLFEFLTLPRDPNGRKGRDILRKCKYCNEYFLAKRADRGNQCYKRTCQRAAIRERVTRLRAAKAS